MVVIDNFHIIFVDVDDTLIFDYNQTLNPDDGVIIEHAGGTEMVVPHKKHINLIKSLHAQGYAIIVMSQGGWDWARAVVEGLELTSYITAVMTKPEKYIDDMDVKSWLKERIYLEP